MSANDELPRGLTQVASRIAAGALVAITFPASAGIAWVLTDVAHTFAMNVGSSQDISSHVDLTGAVALANLIYLEDWFTAGVTSSMSGSWSGKLAGQPGQALTLTVNGGQAGNGNIQLSASAYPV